MTSVPSCDVLCIVCWVVTCSCSETCFVEVVIVSVMVTSVAGLEGLMVLWI